MAAISGITKDHTGAAAVRTFAVYREDTGALVFKGPSSDGTTGGGSGGTWSHIAGEGGTFTVSGSSAVRYGADTRWSSQTFSTGSFTCDSTTFGGDPAYGTSKTCQIQSAALPLGHWNVSATAGVPHTVVVYPAEASGLPALVFSGVMPV